MDTHWVTDYLSDHSEHYAKFSNDASLSLI